MRLTAGAVSWARCGTRKEAGSAARRSEVWLTQTRAWVPNLGAMGEYAQEASSKRPHMRQKEQ